MFPAYIHGKTQSMFQLNIFDQKYEIITVKPGRTPVKSTFLNGRTDSVIFPKENAKGTAVKKY